MIYSKTDVDFTEIQRRYAGIMAAIARTSQLFKVESYLASFTQDNTKPRGRSGKEAALEVFVVVNSDVEWRLLVRHLIDNESFYQGKSEENHFYRRGSLIILKSAPDRGSWAANSHRIG